MSVPPIHELFDYLAGLEPGFAGRTRGASPAEINAFERMVGAPLSALYREFLVRLGHDDGGLDLGRGSTTQLEALMEYYDELNRCGERDCLPQAMTVIAVSGGPTFELSLEQGPEDPRVFLTSGQEIQGLFCESFRKLLFQSAFDRYRMGRFPFSAFYWGGALPLEHVREILLGQGLVEPWFSGTVGFRADGGDLAVVAEQILGRPVWIRIAGLARERVQSMGDQLVARGARIEVWRP